MSILSGIGQTPPVFTSGSSFTPTPPITFDIAELNNGNSATGLGVFLNNPFLGTDLLSNATYKVFFTLSVIQLTATSAIYAQLASNATTVRFTFNTSSTSFIQDITISEDICMGTLVGSGRITTPDLSVYNQPFTLQILGNWSYPTQPTYPLYTSGVLFFEPV